MNKIIATLLTLLTLGVVFVGLRTIFSSTPSVLEVSGHKLTYYLRSPCPIHGISNKKKFIQAQRIPGISQFEFVVVDPNFSFLQIKELLPYNLNQYSNIKLSFKGCRMITLEAVKFLQLIVNGVQTLSLNFQGVAMDESFGQHLTRLLNNLNSLKSLTLLLSQASSQINPALNSLFRYSRPGSRLQNYSLKVTDSALTADSLTGLKDYLMRLSHLKKIELNFKDNNFGSDGAIRIAEGIDFLKEVQQLQINLGKNGIESDGVEAVAKAIGKCRNLSKVDLDLSWSKLKELAAEELLKVFDGNNKVVQLKHAELPANKAKQLHQLEGEARHENAQELNDL